MFKECHGDQRGWTAERSRVEMRMEKGWALDPTRFVSHGKDLAFQ